MTKEIFLIRLGERIRILRAEKNLSQTDLARLLGKDRQNLHRIEKGQVNVSVFHLKEISEALGKKLCEMLDFD